MAERVLESADLFLSSVREVTDSVDVKRETSEWKILIFMSLK